MEFITVTLYCEQISDLIGALLSKSVSVYNTECVPACCHCAWLIDILRLGCQLYSGLW